MLLNSFHKYLLVYLSSALTSIRANSRFLMYQIMYNIRHAGQLNLPTCLLKSTNLQNTEELFPILLSLQTD